jgi:hypothetical protein
MMRFSPQIIYVARDPRDVAASYYHHHRLFFGYTGSCEDFIEALLAEIGKTYDMWLWSSPIQSHKISETLFDSDKQVGSVCERM